MNNFENLGKAVVISSIDKTNNGSSQQLAKAHFNSGFSKARDFALSSPESLREVLSFHEKDLSQARSLINAVHKELIKQINEGSIDQIGAFRFAEVISDLASRTPAGQGKFRSLLTGISNNINNQSFVSVDGIVVPKIVASYDPRRHLIYTNQIPIGENAQLVGLVWNSGEIRAEINSDAVEFNQLNVGFKGSVRVVMQGDYDKSGKLNNPVFYTFFQSGSQNYSFATYRDKPEVATLRVYTRREKIEEIDDLQTYDLKKGDRKSKDDLHGILLENHFEMLDNAKKVANKHAIFVDSSVRKRLKAQAAAHNPFMKASFFERYAEIPLSLSAPAA